MLAPGTSVGRYVIKRKLAEGGMAEIFLASAVGPEGFAKDVVIKVVRSFLANDSQFVQMFIAEARLASRLNHANVVQIFDFGKHGDSYYLAMEYVRGASLWDLRKRCRDLKVPVPPTLAAEVGAQVARGLQYAHALSDAGQRIGVVHRDVTPHNVLLSFEGAVKLTDFGIAKATSTHTAPGMLKGKFAYMSPEQSRGEKVDARSDIFALGVVLWELLTGGRLFDGDSDLAVLRAVQESLIAPPARLNADVPAELSDVVMKALARPVDERFQTAFEFERALATWVLRNAQSVEDTSVAIFLQQMFKEEFEAPQGDDEPAPGQTLSTDEEDFSSGQTVERRKPRTITATPVGPIPLVADGPRRGLLDDEDSTGRKTEEFEANARPRTEQMPALKRPSSRRLEPLPVQEPSVIARPTAQAHSLVSQTETERASAAGEAPESPSEPVTLPRSNAPLIGVLSALVIALLASLGYVTSREEPTLQPVPAAEDPVARVVVPTAPEPEVLTAPVADPVPLAEGVDAGPIVAAAGPEPVKPPDKPPAQVVARKTGTIVVRAVPFATVLVQGKSYEVTGVKNLTVPVGSYEIVLQHPKKQSKERVTVQANQVTTVTFSAE